MTRTFPRRATYLHYSDANRLQPIAVVPVVGAMTIHASDDAGIYSNVKLVSTSITTNDGGAGMLQNSINNSIPADFTTSDGTQAIAFGQRVRLASDFGSPQATAETLGKQVMTSVAPGYVVKLADDYGMARLATSSGIRLIATGDLVGVDDGYEGGGDGGAVYRYLGANGRFDLGAQDYSDATRWQPVAGNGGSIYRYVGPAQSLDLNGQDYTNSSLWAEIGGAAGSVYQYMGAGATLDLGSQDYSDLGFWKLAADTQLIPQGLSSTDAESRDLRRWGQGVEQDFVQ